MKIVFTLSATVVAMLCLRSDAATLQYQFSGVVTEVATPISTEFHVGEPISGHMSVEILASQPIPSHTVTDFSGNIGGDYPISSPGGALTILPADHVVVSLANLSGPSVSGHVPDYLTIQLNYPPNTFTSSDLVPQFIINSPSGRSSVRFDVNDSLSVWFTLSDFSIVPEPSTIALSLISVPLIFTLRRRLRLL